eukprot:TRINITY_DN2589_c0_g1_i1.p1 TRINITY_DN2589_c0_g1~~TRINITY_DN2589_c0_g1_i1.p1  ORF type:complete len:947 (-),score=116.75 TRINITY_DN2589_c0_g1_i1:3033-5873(-)
MARSHPQDDSVAIIGAGAAGLGAAWLLARSGFRVHLYEASPHAGGHAQTIDIPIPNSPTFATVPIDVGFIVYNTTTYPDLVSLFEMLDVEEDNSSMSFAASVHLPKSDVLLEWGSDSLTTLFADRANLYRTSMYTMLYDMRRFNNAVYDFVNRLDTNPHFPDADISLGEFLTKGSYSTTFTHGYLIPMVSAVWSASFNVAMKFPARALFRFFVNHGLAQVFARPQWRTPAKRSRDYVNRIVTQIRESGGIVSLQTPVSSVKRKSNTVTVFAENCDPKDFDHVVFATHAPTTLEILGDNATEDEKKVLGAFKYSMNTGYVHTDRSLMPRNKNVWSAWNFIGRRQSGDETNTVAADEDDPVCVSYWINKLQNLYKSPNPVPDIFLTLNPTSPVDPDKTLIQLTYEHPQFTEEAVQFQPRIQTDLQGRNRSWFCGAYARYGFHEDSLMTGLDVAERLSGNKALRPWRAKQNLAINDHSRPYELPYSPTKSSSFFILFALLVISSVLSRLQYGLGKIAARMADNVPVVVVAVGNGRMHRFGPRRKRSKSISSLNLLRNDDVSRDNVEGTEEPDRARITIKSPRVLIRIADALRHGHDLATTAAAAFAAHEFDCPTPKDLSVALRALFIADRLDLEPSGARKGRAKLAESLLRSFVGSIQRPATLPTNTRLPELTTCITSVVYPSWWLELGEPNDNYSGRLTRVPSVSTDGWFDDKTAMNILEMVGDLSDITVSSLQKNGEARATIVVQTPERVGFVTRKAELLSVSEQIQILLAEDFLKQNPEPFDSGAVVGDPKLFNLILSPTLVNAYKSCGFGSLEDALVFLREKATMDATFELGCTVFGTRRLKADSKKAKGTDSLFSGDEGFVLWKTGDVIECVEKQCFALERMSFLNHDEASADVFEVIERVHGSLATDKLKPDETRTALAQMCLWQAALKVKYVRRMTLSFRMA